MATSILREPPPGSELAARVEAIDRMASAKPEPGSPFVTNPVLIETEELLQVLSEPRLWKLPAEWIVRHDLPTRIKVAYGEEAAAELEQSPHLGLFIAHQLQELDYRSASARKRAKNPPPENRPVIAAVVFGEFMKVSGEMPEATFNRHCMETAQRLGGRGAKTDRASIRRAVASMVCALTRLPERDQKVFLRAVEYLNEIFRPGWHVRVA